MPPEVHLRPEDVRPEALEDKTPAERNNYLMEDAPEDRQDKIDYGTKVNLTEDQETTIKKHCKDNIKEIQDRRDELGLETIWEENENQYYGNLPDKSFPFKDSSNLNMPITREKIDTIVNKVSLARFTPEDIWELLPTQSFGKNIEETNKACHAKQKFLTFECRNELNYEEESSPVDFDATVHGTGILELPWYYETDTMRDVEVYDGRVGQEFAPPTLEKPQGEMITNEGLAQFLKNYPDEDRAQSKETYRRYLRQLKAGKRIEIVVEYDTDVWNNPKPKHVPLRDFFIHPDTTDIKDSRFHGKRYILTGSKLQRKEDEEIFDDIDELKIEATGDGETEEIENFLSKDFTCWTIDLRYGFEGIDKGKEKRYLVDFAYDTEDSGEVTLLRVRRFPYWHNKPFFIPHYISSKKGPGFYREGLVEILTDSQDLANISLNLYLDCLLFGSIPIMKAKLSQKRTLAPQLRKGLYPGLILWLTSNDDVAFDVSKATNLGPLADTQTLANKYAQLLTGVGEYMSGKEASADTRAPAAKTKMLIQQANVRIGGFIKNIQNASREEAFQLIELYYQYRPEGKVYRAVGEDGEVAFPTITRETLRQRTEYNPVGSIDTISKDVLLQKDMQVYEMVNNDPMFQNPAMARHKRYVLEIIFKDLGGIWEKSIDKLLPTEEEIKKYLVEVQAQAMLKAQEMQKQKIQGQQIKKRAKMLIDSGMDKEQVRAQLQSEFGGQGGQGGGQGVSQQA